MMHPAEFLSFRAAARGAVLLLLAACLCPPPRAAVAADRDATDVLPTRVSVSAVRPGVPIGAIVAWPVSAQPYDASAWLECAGQTVTAAAYPALVAALTGSSTATSATLPDLRGLFLRGYGSQSFTQTNGSRNGRTATTHSSGAFMTVQGDAVRAMTGTLPAGGRTKGGSDLNSNLTGVFGYVGPASSPGQGTGTTNNMQALFDNSFEVPVSTEVRPANMAVRYLMRAL